MATDDQMTDAARRLGTVLEPVIGQVYFSPECHAEYEALGFSPSPGKAGGVALPDGPAYFTSRGSALGQVPGEVVAAAFAVFNPAVVVPCIDFGWSITDAPTIAAARTRGATAQLRRILGEQAAGVERATELLARAADPLRPAGRPLFAGVLSLGLPGDPLGDLFRTGDLLREYRGDSHTAAWISAGFDGTEIGLLTELFWGVPRRSYIRTRAWSDEELDAAEARLRERGLIDGEGFTHTGRQTREAIERETDRHMRPAIEALGPDFDELVGLLQGWGTSIRAAGGYLLRPDQLTSR